MNKPKKQKNTKRIAHINMTRCEAVESATIDNTTHDLRHLLDDSPDFYTESAHICLELARLGATHVVDEYLSQENQGIDPNTEYTLVEYCANLIKFQAGALEYVGSDD
jgi:hypothetical protein